MRIKDSYLLLPLLFLLGSPTLAQDTPSGTILFHSDAPCRIEVDGKEVGAVAEANGQLEINIEAGKHLVLATHRDDSSAIFRAVAEVAEGTKEIILVELAEAIKPRFVDQNNGTIKDTKTGLYWLKKTECQGRRTISKTKEAVRQLKDGLCGLTDGSREGDWRLPTPEDWEAIAIDGCTPTPPEPGRRGGPDKCFDVSSWSTVEDMFWLDAKRPDRDFPQDWTQAYVFPHFGRVEWMYLPPDPEISAWPVRSELTASAEQR